MKILLNQAIVLKLTIDQKPLVDDTGKIIGYEPNPKHTPYLVTDIHRDAPRGFGVRVGKTQKSYLLQQRHGKKVIQVVFGNIANFATIDIARKRAMKDADEVRVTGKNPKVAKRERSAAELTLRQCFDEYLAYMTNRAIPVKPNTVLGFNKSRRKFADWEDIKIRDLNSKKITERFDEIAAKTQTAAEQCFRMATTCVNYAIKIEMEDANNEGRAPLLSFNPFLTLTNKKKFRSREELERVYKIKGIRRPLSVRETLGPFLEALWKKRKENPTGCDYWLTCFLLGTRKMEAAYLYWRDALTEQEAASSSWVCMKTRRIFFFDTKNRTDLLLPIPDGLFELFKQRRERAEYATERHAKWVFPARSKFSKNGNYVDGRTLLRYICTEAEITNIAPHDARRTFGNVAEEVTSYGMVKRLLNHQNHSDPTSRYTEAEWERTKEVQQKIECVMLATAPVVYNALLVPKYPPLAKHDGPSNSAGKKEDMGRAGHVS
ncbi:MAG: tyrosine-type recombinase/integrase [Gallionella sp.]